MRRKTKQDYIDIATQRGFIWLGPEVENSKIKTEWQCQLGHRWLSNLNHIQGRGCPECARISRANKMRHPIDNYYTLAKEKNVEWLGPEVKSKDTPTEWRCWCGHRWFTSFSVLKVNGCPNCSGKRPKTQDDYYQIALENNLTWLGPMVPNVKTNTWWLCLNGHKFDVPYTQIQSGHGCRYCANKSPKTPEDYYAIAKQQGLEWLGPEVSRTNRKTLWLCENGHKFSMTYNGIQQGRRCKKCATQRQVEKQRLKIENYQSLADKLGYRWDGPEVKNARQKTWWICDNNHRFKMSYDNLSRGQRCKHCSESNGEKEVSRVLKKLGIEFETQKTFDDCRDKRLLKFDFYFQLIGVEVLVEFDGILHYSPARFFDPDKAKKKLKDTQRRDRIKDDYARQKGMVMIRIPYTEFDRIEEILVNLFSDLAQLPGRGGNTARPSGHLH